MMCPGVNGNCINCTVSITSENQLFNKFTVVDEINSLKILEQEIAVLDAILYIYGLSATNLASAFLDEPREDDLSSCTTISEASDYIIKNGLCLCRNCVSVFKQVYVACHQLKKLSNNEALLRKAIKKFAPPFIKIEVDPDEFRCTTVTEYSESEDEIKSVNLISNSGNFADAEFSAEAAGKEAADLFQAFNFEKDDETEEYCDNDVKLDASDEQESVASSSTTRMVNVSDIFNLVRIEEEKNKRRMQLIKNMKKRGTKKRWSKKTKSPGSGLMRAQQLKLEREQSLATNPESEPEILEGRQKRKAAIMAEMQLIKKMKKKNVWKKTKARPKRVQQLKLEKEESPEEDPDCDSYVQEDGNLTNDNIRDEENSSGLRRRNRILKILDCSCGKAFSSVGSLRQHETRHKVQEPVICETCGASFEKYSLLYVHKNREHLELPGILFQCSKCDKKFYSSSDLKSHESRHGKQTKGYRVSPPREDLEKMVNCSCGKSCLNLQSLQIHEKTHKFQEHVTCDTCGASFERCSLLYIHKNKEHSELPGILFECSKCGKKFIRRGELKDHERRHEKQSKGCIVSPLREDLEKMVNCSCGKPYRTLNALRYHEKAHESLEPVTCDLCDQTFAFSYQLYGHKILNHSEMPHLLRKCDSCDAKFLTTYALENHVRQHHTHSRPFVCEVCGKTFSCRSNLLKHSSIVHTNEDLDKERLKCTECGLTLKHSHSLRNHMKTMHRTEKTIMCHLCGKTTKTNTNMRIHMKIHDPNRTLKTYEPKLTSENNSNLDLH